MAHLVIPVKGASRPNPPYPKRPHAAFIYKKRRITIPIIEPEVEHYDLAADWQTIERVNGKPILRRSKRRLRKMRFTCYIRGKNDTTSIDRFLKWFIRMGNSPDNRVRLSYGPFEKGNWAMTDVTVRSRRRHPRTNAITVAEVDVTLTEFPDEPKAATVRPRSAQRATTTVSATTTKEKSKSYYTVKTGDTLSSIAARKCGSANKWPEIAKANNLKNVHLIYPGQRLIIPC